MSVLTDTSPDWLNLPELIDVFQHCHAQGKQWGISVAISFSILNSKGTLQTN